MCLWYFWLRLTGPLRSSVPEPSLLHPRVLPLSACVLCPALSPGAGLWALTSCSGRPGSPSTLPLGRPLSLAENSFLDSPLPAVLFGPTGWGCRHCCGLPLWGWVSAKPGSWALRSLPSPFLSLASPSCCSRVTVLLLMALAHTARVLGFAGRVYRLILVKWCHRVSFSLLPYGSSEGLGRRKNYPLWPSSYLA